MEINKQWFKDHSKAISIAVGAILAPCAFALLGFLIANPVYLAVFCFVGMFLVFLVGVGMLIYDATKRFIDSL